MPAAVVADAGGVVVNNVERAEQFRLASKLVAAVKAKNMAEAAGEKTSDFEVLRAGKALYDFHAALIQSPKPKRERKAKP